MATARVKDMIEGNKVMIFCESHDTGAKNAVGSFTKDFTVVNVDDEGQEYRTAVKNLSSGAGESGVFIGGKFVGDSAAVEKAAQDGSLQKKLEDAMCNMSEVPGSNPTGSRPELNAPKGPGPQTGHTGKH